MAEIMQLPHGVTLSPIAPEPGQPMTLPQGVTLSPMEQRPQSTVLGDIAAPAAGANRIIPQLLGLPVDVATNVVNLPLALYGTAKGLVEHNLLGNKSYVPPKPLGPQFMGSEWMREHLGAALKKVVGSDPFEVQNPQSKLQQNLALGGNIAGYGLINPAKSGTEMLANVLKMTPSAAGGVIGHQIAPNNPLATTLGMIGPGLAKASLGGVKNIFPKTLPNKTAVNMVNAGYKLLPEDIKGTMTQDMIQSAGGTVPMKQLASVHNQQNTNNLIRQQFGLPEDIPLSTESLQAVRDSAGKSYEVAKQYGVFKPDFTFKSELNNIVKPSKAISTELPILVKKDIQDYVKNFDNPLISSEATIDAIKQLRADSNAGYASLDPATKELAKAKGRIADALEGLMERQTQKTNPQLSQNLKDARKTIAQTYTVQKALKQDGNVDAVALGRELTKGKPLSGNVKTVAQFGQKYNKVAQVNPPQVTNFRPMDFVMAVLGGQVNPWLYGSLFARPAIRAALLSDAYQGRLAKMPSAPAAAGPNQALAAALMANNLGNGFQTNSQK